jgi:SAM-dependent methyltransferase
MNKPYSEACEQNKDVIFEVIERLFKAPGEVLEIGSGTAQHAVYFAPKLPHLQWRASDQREYHAGIKAWLDEADHDNLHGPLELDVNQSDWPVENVDYVFSANAVHIMSWPSVEAMLSGIGHILKPQGLLVLYGPFNYRGQYTSDSNARFDVWLKQRDADSGIRDFEKLNELAIEQGMQFLEDVEMPVNNRILVWQKNS